MDTWQKCLVHLQNHSIFHCVQQSKAKIILKALWLIISGYLSLKHLEIKKPAEASLI